jgi:hypothetical protein
MGNKVRIRVGETLVSWGHDVPARTRRMVVNRGKMQKRKTFALRLVVSTNDPRPSCISTPFCSPAFNSPG